NGENTSLISLYAPPTTVRRPVFLASSPDLTLVLQEDGTGVECEAFFQALHSHKALMVLERGQMWTESKLICPTSQKPQGSGIANLTFDLFKLHRKEFLGCLSIRATFYEMYMFSYDLGYTRAKPAIKLVEPPGGPCVS
ncbi:lipid transferase CIDEA, partial [Gadus macrocephalus]|uniref:lipid transferase CIDEA n=1 Tax=Gadus macrocephalus TaxID=80720 RepID=UPI0028CB88AF